MHSDRSSLAEPADTIRDLPRCLVLIGLMGAGKTAVGRRLARTLGLPFLDADWEIEAAAGMPVKDIFQLYGEPAFRDLERRVIERLLDGEPKVLALGGGAFIHPSTREAVARSGYSIWLRARPETLARRTARRRQDRPLLKDGDHLETLRALAAERDPIYARADLAVEGEGRSVEMVVQDIVTHLRTTKLPPAEGKT
ncbi:shikimate kinase [Marinivivus vitaminiproducens]|uniref:shikimate kinase n=1 Tax=Marinivivus vitaminiproducens TaxID=3035935 RepID=UPI0027A5B89D|nr:shikimate kinase [Geminicoccaceae bacterium SCSIO 64248]